MWTSFVAAALLAAGAPGRAPAWSAEELRRIAQLSPLPPPPASRLADEPAAARLGQFLFFDPRLSANGSLSCASCHVPHHGFADGRPLGQGLLPGKRNTPSLWNVAYNRWFFWDGRADSLWAQALQPIESPAELGGSRARVARLLVEDPALSSAYEAVFGPLPEWQEPLGPAPEVIDRVFVDVGKAIAAYERRLVSRHAPFDRFVAALRQGDAVGQAALSPAAQRGLRLFLGKGQCTLCHHGPNFTDGEFHATGVPPRSGSPPDPGRLAGIALLRRDPFNTLGPFAEDPGGPASQRLGQLAAGPETWGQLKTPSLRNVALTAPYMHQGQFENLRQVVGSYSTLRGATFHHQPAEALLAPRNFSREETDELVAGLESLTDVEVDPALLEPPASPGLAADGPF